MLLKKKNDSDKKESFSEMSFSEKLEYIIDTPFDFMRKCTLPPCEDEKY
jgi:hypothetical protein